MADRTILVDSLSKTFAMTGWRCGYAAVPEPLIEPLTRFIVNSTSCVPAFVQHAAVAALAGPMDGPRAMIEEFRVRRDILVEGLNALPGVSCRMPAGAFYAFPNVSALPLSADSSPTVCSKRQGLQSLPEAPSAPKATTTSVSPTRTRATTSSARPRASGHSSNDSECSPEQQNSASR